MWTEKYQPKRLEDLCIKQDKIDAFSDLVKTSRILVLTGPSGCGKNSLIRTFSKEENLVLKYHFDIKASWVDDLGLNYDHDSIMPDDLQGLIGFIKEIKNGAKSTAQTEFKKSSFFKNNIQIPQKSHTNNAEKSQSKGSIYVVRGLPECLKLSSVY